MAPTRQRRYQRPLVRLTPAVLTLLDFVERVSGVLPRRDGDVWVPGLVAPMVQHDVVATRTSYGRTVAGLRYDRLAIGNVDAASNTANLYLPPHAPSRTTLMLDWAPSEFSRVRLQWANDRVRYGLVDNQFLIQYQMSLGAHGAHGF